MRLDPARTVVVATGNAHKVIEIEAILSPAMPGVRFVALGELGDYPDPEEDGETFFDNALIKARAAQAETGLLMAVADDSGLCVDALDGAPGSSRHAGRASTETMRPTTKSSWRRWQTSRTSDARRASTRAWCSCAVTRSCAATVTARAWWAGSRAVTAALATTRCFSPTRPRAARWPSLSLDEKNLISHRFHALEDLAAKL